MILSLVSVGFLMIVTFLVLYWNYYENVHRKLNKKQGVILDHWGKGSPSAAETAILDIGKQNKKRGAARRRRAE